MVVAAVLAVGGGATAWVVSRQSAENHSSSAFRTAPLKRGDLVSQISATGRVISNLDVVIKSKASGRVQALPSNVSDFVRQGDLLVELDPQDEQRQVRLQQAEVDAAQARLQQAQHNRKIAETQLGAGRRAAEAELLAAQQRNDEAQSSLRRREELFGHQVINQQELDTARTEARSAASALECAQAKMDELATMEHTVELRQQEIQLCEAQLKSAQIALEFAQQRLEETRICSPMDGVVTERLVQIGQIIASGISNIAGGTPILAIADLSQMFVVASVDESDIGGVQLGQRATVTVDAFPGRRFEGVVDRIAAKGVNSSNVVTFDVWIKLQSEALQTLKPEMTANVEIIAQTRQNVLLAPNEAIQYGSEGYAVEVVLADGSIEKRPVKTGPSDGVFTELVEGGQEGQTVALRGNLRSRWSNAGRGAQQAAESNAPPAEAPSEPKLESQAAESSNGSAGGNGKPPEAALDKAPVWVAKRAEQKPF